MIDLRNFSLFQLLKRIVNGSGGGNNSVVSEAAGSNIAFTIKDANSDRVEIIIFNDTNKMLLVKFGDAVAEGSFSEKVGQDESITTGSYKGKITAKNIDQGGAASGTVHITEITP